MGYLCYKFRLYPNLEQQEHLNKTLGSCRFVYNNLLSESIKEFNKTGKFIFGYGLQNKIVDLKKEYPWLKDVNSQSLQVSSHNLAKAFKNKFKKNSKRSGFPKFKSRKRNGSFTVPQNFSIIDNRIKIPKLTPIKFKQHLDMEGKIKYLHITKEIDRWFVVFVNEVQEAVNIVDNTSVVGIDLGIKSLAVTSDGEILQLPEILKDTKKKIKKLHQKHSRKKKGSRNKEKARVKLAKGYRKHNNQKKDYLRKQANSITKNYDIVVMENLNVAGMKKGFLSRSIHNACMSQFKGYLKEKAKLFVEVDRFFPSSKTCSACGFVKKDLTLANRTYNCNNCGYEIDRDLNAAINLKNTVGTTEIQACEDTAVGKEPFGLIRQVSLKQEAIESLGSW